MFLQGKKKQKKKPLEIPSLKSATALPAPSSPPAKQAESSLRHMFKEFLCSTHLRYGVCRLGSGALKLKYFT